MSVIYENEVKACGPMAKAFDGILVIFGDNAPAEIKDFCYAVSVNPINGTIQAGQTVRFGDEKYKITAVGEEAPHTLAGLGHCSFNFSGQTEVELPGTIYLEKKPMPNVEIGTKIQIIG